MPNALCYDENFSCLFISSIVQFIGFWCKRWSIPKRMLFKFSILIFRSKDGAIKWTYNLKSFSCARTVFPIFILQSDSTCRKLRCVGGDGMPARTERMKISPFDDRGILCLAWIKKSSFSIQFISSKISSILNEILNCSNIVSRASLKCLLIWPVMTSACNVRVNRNCTHKYCIRYVYFS